MNYILTMTLSGSMMVLFYGLIACSFANRLQAKARYLLLKGAVLYYLIPLPFLRSLYTWLLRKWGFYQLLQNNEIPIVYSYKSLILFDGDRYYANQALKIQIFVVVIWLSVGIFIVVKQLLRYYRGKKQLLNCRGLEPGTEESAAIEDAVKKYCIKRKVVCLDGTTNQKKQNSHLAFTMGFFKPVIFYQNITDKKDRELVLCHELAHVKQWDVLWKILSSCVLAIHWFNPLAWWLAGEMEKVCEMTCDDRVLHGRREEEKVRYAELILEMARGNLQSKQWSFSMSKQGKAVKERMENIIKNEKNERKWEKCVFMCVFGGVLLLNSLTVFAYDDVQYYSEDANSVGKLSPEGRDIIFFPDGVDMSENPLNTEIPEILYSNQFVDDTGKIYSIENKVPPYAVCNHLFQSGTSHNHIKNGNGGCSLISYSAMRCSICGHTAFEELLSTVTYPKCNHSF